MTDAELIATVPGAQAVVDLYGQWPDFHDAEVLSIELHREGVSRIPVHVFATSSEADAQGHYHYEKHAVVTFLIEEIVESAIAYFNHQNVLFGLDVRRAEEGLLLRLQASYGVEAVFIAKKIAVELLPGIPADSGYHVVEENGSKP